MSNHQGYLNDYQKSQKKELLIRILKENPSLGTDEISTTYRISKTHIKRVRAWIKNGDKRAILPRYALPSESTNPERVRCLGPCHEGEDFYFLSVDRKRNRICSTCRESSNRAGPFAEYKVML